MNFRFYKDLADWIVRRIAQSFGLAVLTLAVNGAAKAAYTESLSTTSSYSYALIPGLPGSYSGEGDSGSFALAGSQLNQATDIKVNYSSLTAPDSSFFFLHNIQCKGYCSVAVTTTLSDVIANTGSEPIDLKLISGITAGHLGLVRNANSQSSGVFEFDVTQTSDGSDKLLYKALGKVASAGASITTSDGSVFNNLTSYTDTAQFGLDWDATDLSVLLSTLAPGETTTVTYSSITYLNSYGICSNATRCDGVQVAFGDPRNNGGIFSRQADPASLARQPIGYVLDRGFDMATLKFDVIDVSGVPEPNSWAMMVIGFGLCGAAVRRRHGTALSAA